MLTHVHYVSMMHSLYMWSEDNFWELALSLYHLDSSAFSQVIRLSARHLSPLHHLSDPICYILFFTGPSIVVEIIICIVVYYNVFSRFAFSGLNW